MTRSPNEHWFRLIGFQLLIVIALLAGIFGCLIFSP